MVDSNDVAIRGNQIIALGAPFNFSGIGIDTVDFPQTITIEGNQPIGWSIAIRARGDGKIVRKNELSLNSSGINISGTSRAEGNVIVACVGLAVGQAFVARTRVWRPHRLALPG